MNRHTKIRQAVLDRLRKQDDVVLFDGLPAFIDTEELPAVAVYLTDAQYTGGTTDEDNWKAYLHIAVFLKAQAPDSELDEWMENRIYPVMNDIPALARLVDTIVPQGYDYQRDNEMASWGMAKMSWLITYTNEE